MKRLIHLWVVATFASLLMLVSCQPNSKEAAVSGQNELTHSQLLSMRKHGNGTMVEIANPWDSTKLRASYLLVPTDETIPQDIDSEVTIIRTPVTSLVAYTSVYAGAIKELGSIDVVTGVTDAQFYKIPEIVDGLKSGKIIDAGKSDSPIAERIIELSPDAILLTIYQGMEMNTVQRLGIPILKFVDNMENTPLGRAEWIKLMGELTGTRQTADSIFNQVKASYQSLRDSALSVSKRPKVMVENMYQGVWYVSGGNSYQARMIADAGGDYAWKDDTSTGSLFLSFEQVLDKAEGSDIWLLKVFGTDLTAKSLTDMDSRTRLFKPFSTGGVYYSNTAVSNLFEEFPFHPELMLRDYICIFHPTLLSDNNLRYFNQMKP